MLDFNCNLFVAKQEHKTKESTCAENVCASTSGDWAAYQTPDGYWYYFNNQTGGKILPNDQLLPTLCSALCSALCVL